MVWEGGHGLELDDAGGGAPADRAVVEACGEDVRSAGVSGKILKESEGLDADLGEAVSGGEGGIAECGGPDGRGGLDGGDIVEATDVGAALGAVLGVVLGVLEAGGEEGGEDGGGVDEGVDGGGLGGLVGELPEGAAPTEEVGV